MPTVGEKLRNARERQGLDLARVANETRISQRYLEAIERDDLSTLPSEFFYKSFAKQYAQTLGLETNEIEGDLQRSLEPVGPSETFDYPIFAQRATNGKSSSNGFTGKRKGYVSVGATLPEPAFEFDVEPSSEVPASVILRERTFSKRWAALALVLIAGSAGYLAWQRMEQNKAREPQVAAAPAPAPTTQEPPRPVAESTPPAEVPPQPAAAPVETAAADLLRGTGGEMRLEVAASERTWIRLAADGKVVWQGLLESGQRKVLESATQAVLLAGNAGAVSVVHNGKDVGPIGERGQVRLLAFNREGWQLVQAQQTRPVSSAGNAAAAPPSLE
jgi:cytoskeletal protein RodZ